MFLSIEIYSHFQTWVLYKQGICDKNKRMEDFLWLNKEEMKLKKIYMGWSTIFPTDEAFETELAQASELKMQAI